MQVGNQSNRRPAPSEPWLSVEKCYRELRSSGIAQASTRFSFPSRCHSSALAVLSSDNSEVYAPVNITWLGASKEANFLTQLASDTFVRFLHLEVLQYFWTTLAVTHVLPLGEKKKPSMKFSWQFLLIACKS